MSIVIIAIVALLLLATLGAMYLFVSPSFRE